MNDLINDFCFGPLGWKIACAVVALVGVLLTIAFLDGLSLRKGETKEPPNSDQAAHVPPADSLGKGNQDE